MVLGVISSEPYALQSSDTFRDPHPHYLPPSVLFPHSLFQSRSLGCFTHSHCVESSVHSNYSTITSIIIIVILFSIQPTLLNCKAGEVLPWCGAILMTSAPIKKCQTIKWTHETSRSIRRELFHRARFETTPEILLIGFVSLCAGRIVASRVHAHRHAAVCVCRCVSMCMYLGSAQRGIKFD